ncbi:histidine phosphatase family protein [Bacillus sp. B15-48]|uniref:histidine phosphatase family protein n=1 Tax=Bacillus sp. B15-48 TaxID=1548601 RepID=UPI00193F7B20|nr:histidine phosphatase family protein [Bacillus sp. B15-48]MBM4763268.1 histidine phosphatase family protein [Bacillus sp. B15-48]
MLNVYVIRHGETEWNVQKRMQGRLDSALTEKGRENAILLGERLKNTQFKRIFSSPSPRAMATAKIVRDERKIPIEEDDKLLEIDLGEWQGKTEAEIKALFPAEFHSYFHKPEKFINLVGEVFVDVQKRVSEFLNDLEDTTPEGNVLVVTHGVVVKTLLLLCRQAPIAEMWSSPSISGTSLTIVRIQDGKKELVLEGCTKHCSF